VEIDGLNEKAILDWWNEAKKDPRFRMFGRNCSNIVTDALRAGGVEVPFPPAPRTVFQEATQIRDLGPDWFSFYQWLIIHSLR
jgi:hypothetical protein